jgi:predicted transposase YbfD/YdcC
MQWPARGVGVISPRKSEKIIAKKADYVVALKANEGTLREDVEVFVAEQKACDFKDTTIGRDETIDADHARIETTTTTVIDDAGWLQDRHKWPGLNGVVIIDSSREISGSSPGTGKIEKETRFYIISLTLPANRLGPIVRSHWSVENSLHRVLDIVFRDDECRVRTDHAPANFTTIKHMAQNLLHMAQSKHSIRLKRKIAARDDDLASLVPA